jgi:hypothetical protein
MIPYNCRQLYGEIAPTGKTMEVQGDLIFVFDGDRLMFVGERCRVRSSGPLARFRAKWVPARVKKSVRNALEPPVPIQSERGALVSGPS